MSGSELMTTEEAATRLRASVGTLARWRGEGSGPPYVKLGGRVFYREPDIAVYIDAAVRTKTRELQR